MTIERTMLVVGVLALGAAGCGTSAPETVAPDAPAPTTAQESSPETETTAPETETTQEPGPAANAESPTKDSTQTGEPTAGGDEKTNERGNIVTKVGEVAGIDGKSGEPIVEFTLADVETDFDCPSDIADKSANGQFVALTFDVKTLPALAQEEFVDTFSISSYDLTVFDADGTRENDSSGTALFCLDPADELPSDIGPGQQASGKVVLDTALDSGTVVFQSYLTDGAGWEWSF